MDPMQKLLADVAKLKGKLDEGDIDEYVRHETGGKLGYADLLLQQQEKPVTAADLGRSAAQGLTLGHADEAYGLWKKATGGSYTAGRDEVRANDKAFKAAHPKTAIAAELTGALPTLLLPVGEAAGGVTAAGKIPGIVRSIGQGAKMGGLFGAISGEGNSEATTLGGVAGDVAKGGTIGGIAGGVLGGMARLGANTVSKLWERFHPEQAGAERATTLAAKTIDEGSYRSPTGDIGPMPRGMQGAQEVRRQLASVGHEGDVMVGDLSPELGQMADVAATENPGIRAQGEALLQPRQAEMGPKLARELRQGTGVGPKSAVQARRAAKQDVKDFGAAAYDGLRAENPVVSSPALVESLRTPDVLRGLRVAKKHSEMLGDELPPAITKAIAMFSKDASGKVTEPAQFVSTFREVHEVSKALRRATTKMFNSGDGEGALAVRAARRKLDDALEKEVPGYLDVNAQYATKQSVVSAYAEGADMLYQDPELLTQRMGELAGPSLEAFRLGAVHRLTRQLGDATKGADVASSYFANAGATTEARMRALFPDEASYTQFMRSAKGEAALAKLYKAFGKGSQTAPRQAVADAVAGDAPSVMQLTSPTSMAASAVNGMVNSVPKQVRPATMQSLGQRMLAPAADLERIAAEADALKQTSVSRASKVAGGASSAAALFGGRLGGLFSQLQGQ